MKIIIISLTVLLATSGLAYSATYISKGGLPACVLKSDLIDFLSYAAVNDEPPATKLLNSKRCIVLKDGLEVQLMDSQAGTGVVYVEIRMIGQSITVWTIDRAIKKKS